MTNGNGNGPNGDTPQPDPIQKLTEYVESVEISDTFTRHLPGYCRTK
jgi:hypothetical protein